MEFTFMDGRSPLGDKPTGETPGATPGQTKIKNQGTPTPEFERRGGEPAKRGRGEPIPMQSDMEPQVGNRVILTRKTYAEVAMEKAQEAAMAEAPPWAKVILNAIKTNIATLGQVTVDLGNSIKFTDIKVEDLEKENTRLKTEVDDHQISLDAISLRLAKMDVAYKNLEERVIRQEAQARKPNLLFCGLAEDNRDSWFDCRRKVDRVMADMGLDIDPRMIKVDKSPPARTPTLPRPF